jgi:hypothetical protein
MPWKPGFPGERPTLGHLVIEWMIAKLACPDRADYEPFVPYLEQQDFILEFYEVDPLTGRRIRRRGVFSRARGHGKSPLLAALALAEALGPVVPAGWDADGQPQGVSWSTKRTPLVHILAVSEAQTQNTWAPLLEMCQGPVYDDYPGLEPMETFVNLPRGKIVPITSSARTVKGARPVFAVLDQALALDTPIPTPTGWTTMGALEVGDQVFGSDGQPVKVTQAKPVSFDHECYRVTFADGTSVVASEGHLWLTRVCNSGARPRVRKTGEMVRDGRTFRAPVGRPFDTPIAELPVHPYLLGLWLGDGTRNKCEISVGARDANAVMDILRDIGVESWPRIYSPATAVNLTFTRARGFGMVDRPDVAKAFTALSCYRDKHVPEEYLAGSIAQRTALVQGLMDADGFCSTKGGCLFVNTSKRLADALTVLLRSLGQVTTGSRWKPDARYSGGGIYRVAFTPRRGFMPFRLSRKAARVSPCRRGPDWVTITSIEPVPRVPVRCIAVDSEDHLFSADLSGFLTHNTEEWVSSNGGLNLFQKVKNNTAKVGGSFVESPNAFIPGEDSVAEQSAQFWQAIQEGRAKDRGLYWDHREAPPETDMADRDSLLKGLRYAYGDSSGDPRGCVIHTPPCPPGHVDLDHLIATIWDPTSDPQVSRADFLNQITHATNAYLSQPEWAAVADPSKVIADRDLITLGFDGSRGKAKGKPDATALIGCRVEDGHLFEIGVWECPDDKYLWDRWEPPITEIESAIKMCFDRWNVGAFYADPAKDWRSHVNAWEARYGAKTLYKPHRDHPFEWWMTGGRSGLVQIAVESFEGAVRNQDLSHDGSYSLTRHALAARRRLSHGKLALGKDNDYSSKKIDAVVAAVLAWQARLDCIAAGIVKPRRRAVGIERIY